MPFAVTQQHIDQYRADGFTVFRRVLPASLVADLRHVADPARELARAKHGPQAQRLQPVFDHPLDHRAFRDYMELPALIDAVRAVLTPRHTHTAGVRWLALLFEPAESAWCTAWHRDWRDNTDIDAARWRERFHDIAYFNQANCALYDDACTWLVPGSHRRDDTPGERSVGFPQLDRLGAVEAEQAIQDYCRSMPGTVPVQLEPGDYALYRNTLWHLGAYLPYQRRATLHDGVDTPEFVAWRDEVMADATRRRAERAVRAAQAVGV